ncbi:MAG: hypothetical protein ACI9K4_001770, partial [Polaribacter sp.]
NYTIIIFSIAIKRFKNVLNKIKIFINPFEQIKRVFLI